MSATTGTAERGVLLAFGYSIGLRLPFLLAALAFRRALRVFGFTRRHARTIMRIGGAVLIVVGILQVTGVWMYFTGRATGSRATSSPCEAATQDFQRASPRNALPLGG